MKGTPGSRPDPDAPGAGPNAPVRALVLVGFMGAGKTSVGQALSAQLGWRFEDLDDRVEAREGRTVPEIFRDSGEAEFRRAEHAALRELLAESKNGPPVILALGGGAFTQAETAVLVEGLETPTVFLDAPPEELWRRCSTDPVERPLRRDQREFQHLYDLRKPRYQQARLCVQTGSRTVGEVVNEILESLSLPGPAPGKEK
jgi:shikimate kinase